MATLVDILGLIAARRARRPARALAALDALFMRLAGTECADEALRTEDRIWDVWMHHPHRGAAQALQRATDDIAARRYDIAETRLSILLRRAPDFAEAWHKRATLYYLLGRDAECLSDIRRTLQLEPRHFAAILHFAEILLGAGAAAEARFAFVAALSLHPHHARARAALFDKGSQRQAEEKPGLPIIHPVRDSIYNVKVAKDLEDLIPVFMRNRQKELDTLKVALAAADFEQLRQLGHRMTGVGDSYGFAQVTTIGKCIEHGARSGDRASLAARIAEYGEYLSRVQITYE